MQVIQSIEPMLVNPYTLAVNTDVVLWAATRLGLPNYMETDLIEKIAAYADVLTDFIVETRKRQADNG